MPSQSDTDAASGTSQPEPRLQPRPPAPGNTAEALALALARFAETERERLVLVQELNRRVSALEQAQSEQRQQRRLELELEALRREPGVTLGWLAAPLRQAARKALGKPRYRKAEFQLAVERSIDSVGASETIAWVHAVVDEGDMPLAVAYSLLAEALAARREYASVVALARALKQRHPDDPALEELGQRIAREQATPVPRVQGNSVLWRSKIGPRVHELALPQSQLAQSAWLPARRGFDNHARALTVLTLGEPDLGAWLGAAWDTEAATLEHLQRDLLQRSPDLLIVTLAPALELVDASTGASRGSPSLSDVATLCEQVSALPILWLTADALEAYPTERLGRLQLPLGMLAFADTSATCAALGRAGVDSAVHALGPVVETRTARLSERSTRATLRRLDFDQTHGPLSENAPPGLAGTELDPAPQLLVVTGNPASATSEQLTSIAGALSEGCALLWQTHSQAGVTGPLRQAPAIGFDEQTSLARTLIDLERQPQRLARQQQLGLRFAAERLGRSAALRRFVAHSGLPNLHHRRRLISVLCVSNRPAQARHCLESFRRQSYPHKELVFVANADVLEDPWVEQFVDQTPAVTLLRTDAAYSLGESLNRARAVANGELWAKFDDDDHYGPHFLRDSLLALERGDAAVTGKGTFFCYVKEQDKLYLNPQHPENSLAERFVHGGTLVADRRFVEGIDFQPVKHGTDSLFLQECKLQGHRIFSGDRYNFAYIRYPSPSHHTYGVSNQSYLRSCRHVCDGFDAQLIDI